MFTLNNTHFHMFFYNIPWSVPKIVFPSCPLLQSAASAVSVSGDPFAGKGFGKGGFGKGAGSQSLPWHCRACAQLLLETGQTKVVV